MNTPTETPANLTDLAVDVVNRYDDELLWNEFFSLYMASGKPVKPGHSGARMAAELLAAEVIRLRSVERDANAKIAKLEKRVEGYVDRDSLKAGNA